ncbi:M15 family metallopeptidase [Demequina gelatinilytica]|uniref:M15 family metallopeptidase n=1 Tax=Demequina gelatinilytica TaxID=1638980 RepID=UPI0007808819|nr:M15 family metallopeptidase [Demequina gelatinilytica]
MDAIAAIEQRISEIHSLIGAVSPGTASTAVAYSAAASSTAFATTLATAVSSVDPLATAAAQLNADGVPTTLAGYGNGLIPESALSPITGSTERLWAPAAEQLDALLADAQADGVVIGITDGYRDYDTQVGVAASKGLYQSGGLAAVPGTSQHGWGLAVDLSLDDDALAWMRENAGRYGFVEAVAREPWHWEFQPAA